MAKLKSPPSKDETNNSQKKAVAKSIPAKPTQFLRKSESVNELQEMAAENPTLPMLKQKALTKPKKEFDNFLTRFAKFKDIFLIIFRSI